MRKLVLAAILTGAMALVSVESQAFPGAPLNPMPAPSDVIQVAGGCGPGWHRGPYGGCRRNWYGAYAYAGPRCGWHPSPWGPQRFCRW